MRIEGRRKKREIEAGREGRGETAEKRQGGRGGKGEKGRERGMGERAIIVKGVPVLVSL